MWQAVIQHNPCIDCIWLDLGPAATHDLSELTQSGQYGYCQPGIAPGYLNQHPQLSGSLFQQTLNAFYSLFWVGSWWPGTIKTIDNPQRSLVRRSSCNCLQCTSVQVGHEKNKTRSDHILLFLSICCLHLLKWVSFPVVSMSSGIKIGISLLCLCAWNSMRRND